MNDHELIDIIYNAIALGQGARLSAEFADDNRIIVTAKDGTEYYIAVKVVGVTD